MTDDSVRRMAVRTRDGTRPTEQSPEQNGGRARAIAGFSFARRAPQRPWLALLAAGFTLMAGFLWVVGERETHYSMQMTTPVSIPMITPVSTITTLTLLSVLLVLVTWWIASSGYVRFAAILGVYTSLQIFVMTVMCLGLEVNLAFCSPSGPAMPCTASGNRDMGYAFLCLLAATGSAWVVALWLLFHRDASESK